MSSEGAPGAAVERASFPLAFVLLATLVGVALRIPGLLQEPWLDEIWSWGLARSRVDAGAVLTIESSNSHALNTLWIWLLGDRADFVAYRLPAFASGVLTIPLAAWVAWRHGRAAAVVAAWLFALSYLGIVYSSEARGYAPMVFLALATHACAWAWLDTARTPWLAAATACVLLGVGFQSLYVLAWGAVALGVVARTLNADGERKLARLAAFALPPLAAFAAWWFVNLRHVFNAGAPEWTLGGVLTETGAAAFGVPATPLAVGAAALAAAAILFVDARALHARRDAERVTTLAAVILVPIATAVVLRHEYLAQRYFVVPIAFWLLACARVLGLVATRRPALAIGLALFFAAGNALHVVPFLHVGRGNLEPLVRSLAERTASEPIVVTGNYDFNVNAQLQWHARALPAGRTVRYAPQRALPAVGPDFVIHNEPRLPADVAREIEVARRRYVLVDVARYAGPSGSEWALYQRE